MPRVALDEREKPTINAGFEEVTEGEEVDRREKLKTKWAQIEAIVRAGKRVALVAHDIVEHFESRQDAMDGKAMVVCMSRRICIDRVHSTCGSPSRAPGRRPGGVTLRFSEVVPVVWTIRGLR